MLEGLGDKNKTTPNTAELKGARLPILGDKILGRKSRVTALRPAASQESTRRPNESREI